MSKDIIQSKSIKAENLWLYILSNQLLLLDPPPAPAKESMAKPGC